MVTSPYKQMIKTIEENSFNVRDNYKQLPVEELRLICKQESRTFRLCCLNVEGDLNIGMMLRSASLFGCGKAYVFGRRKFDRRSLVGAHNYLDIEFIDGQVNDDQFPTVFAEFVHNQRNDGYATVAVEQGGANLTTFKWPAHGRVTLVIGNESRGIPKSFLAHCDTIVSIPQSGVLRSFNAAAAANIVMWDYVTRED